jgi:putative membrane protein
MIVPQSARYREAGHVLGIVLALMMLAILLLWDRAGWGGNLSPAWILLAVVLAYGLGDYLGSSPLLIRLIISRQRMDEKVRYRAEAAFHEHGLHKTREGTGILIMVSLLEHRVQVLADRAINEKVPAGIWDDLVQELVERIKRGEAVEGLCQMIARCGELLARHFPAGRKKNPDELRDDLIQEQ